MDLFTQRKPHPILSDIGLLAVRIGGGVPLLLHGTQKLFGWFYGPGLDNTATSLESLGYKPGEAFAVITAVTEVGAGILLLLGLLTPLACAAMIGVMLNAIFAVHVPHGFIASGGDYPLALLAIGLGIAFTGPGQLSIDYLLCKRSWARCLSSGTIPVGAVVLGFAAAILTLLLKA